MQPEKVFLTVLFSFIYLLTLVYASFIQQHSPLCRVLSGQEARIEADSAVIVYSGPEKQEFAIRISDAGIEIDTKYDKKGDVFNRIVLKEKICGKNISQYAENEKKTAKIEKKDEKSSKNIEFCPFSAENIAFFLENWKNNPKNFYLASRLFFDSENDLNLVEKITLMQAFLRGNSSKNGKFGEISLKSGKEKQKSISYSVEIMNASGNADAAVVAAAWMHEKGFNPIFVPGMTAGQDKTEIFAYGSKNAAQEIKELLCGKKEDVCWIKEFGAKESVNAAVVLGRDFSKFFNYKEKNKENSKNIAKKAENTAKNSKKNEKTAKNNAKRQQNKAQKQKSNVKKPAKKQARKTK